MLLPHRCVRQGIRPFVAPVPAGMRPTARPFRQQARHASATAAATRGGLNLLEEGEIHVVWILGLCVKRPRFPLSGPHRVMPRSDCGVLPAEETMSDGWTWKGVGAPWVLEVSHGVWAVSELRLGGRAELRYAPFNEEGHLPFTPLAIGEFASAGDARLAADLFEAADTAKLPEDLENALLSGTGEIEIMGPDGRAFLLSYSGEAVTLSRDEGRAWSEWARLDQPRVSGEGPEHPRPPNKQEQARTALAIMFRVLHAMGATH